MNGLSAMCMTASLSFRVSLLVLTNSEMRFAGWDRPVCRCMSLCIVALTCLQYVQERVTLVHLLRVNQLNHQRPASYRQNPRCRCLSPDMLVHIHLALYPLDPSSSLMSNALLYLLVLVGLQNLPLLPLYLQVLSFINLLLLLH
jgi:hypothetical protein